MANDNEQLTNFNFKKNPQTIIKVVGVGGGGGNAVTHMYREGIHNVSFVLCNTDGQALQDSPVPQKIQLGKEGLGAGNKPEKGKAAAQESISDIKQMLNDGTKMVFITAGMGGGTGTGAAPVIAQISKDMGILTVGIVTIPFLFEGIEKIDQALDGVDEIKKHVDALLVINNQRLLDICSGKTMDEAFRRADETLSIAARSIAEIIMGHGYINLDFNDVTTTLKDGGVAIMSIGYGEGEGRIKNAIQEALHSPLLNNNDVYNAKKILLNIAYNNTDEKCALGVDEMLEVQEFMKKLKRKFECKWGVTYDQTLDKKIKVTILASGFDLETIHQLGSKQQDTQSKQVSVVDNDEEEKDQRRGKYYHDQNQSSQPRYHLYCFPAEDLDNEDVINRIDSIPAYKRTKEDLNELKKLSLKTTAQPVAHTEEKEESSSESGSAKIVF